MPARFNAAEEVLRRSRSDPARFSAKPALIEDDRVTTYGELWDLVERAAGALRSMRLERTQRLCLLMDDGPLAGAAFLGALSAGIVPVPLNTRLSAQDYAFIVKDCKAKHIIAGRDYLALIEPLARLGVAVHSAHDGPASFQAKLAASPSAGSIAETYAEEPAFWLYSSGTTGRPKGIIHSHASCAQSGKLLREAMCADESSVVLATSKMFFAYGLENGLLAPLSMCATAIQFSGWPDPEQVVEQAARHRATCLLTVPSFYRRMLRLGPEKLAALRPLHYCYTGGERLPEAVAREWERAPGHRIYVGYGLSETLCNVTANAPGSDRGPASIGKPLRGVLCRLLDVNECTVAPGDPGILWVKHPALALGYSDPELTARSFRDGWFCTNDLCTVDADGFLYHHGRSDELLKVSGQWVRPGEVEDAVLSDQDVQEAACIVVPDTDGFDRLALFVVPARAGADVALVAERRCAQSLPRFSRPKWVRTVAELPKNATGKVQKFKLREALERERSQR